MSSRRLRLVLSAILIAAGAALILLAPQGATKDRAAVPLAETSAQTIEFLKIMPADAGRDATEWPMRTGDQSAN